MAVTALLPFVADVRRKFVVQVDCDARPVTTNAVANMHRMAWAGKTAKTRALWCDVIKTANVPHLEQVVITITPLHKDKRSPQDPAACAPEAKAAIDGLVDAGVLEDDNGKFLVAVVFLPPEITGSNGLRMTINEVV